MTSHSFLASAQHRFLASDEDEEGELEEDTRAPRRNKYNLLNVVHSDSEGSGEEAAHEDEEGEEDENAGEGERVDGDEQKEQDDGSGSEQGSTSGGSEGASDSGSAGPSAPRRKSRGFRYFEDGPKCHRCGMTGHLQADCSAPSIAPCLLCGQVGHLERECPEAVCYRCGRVGHESRNCRETVAIVLRAMDRREATAGEMRGTVCVACGKTGHVNCQETSYAKGELPRGGFLGQCCNCAGPHPFEQCTSPKVDELWAGKFKGGSAACFRCGGFGHISQTCPKGSSNYRRHSNNGFEQPARRDFSRPPQRGFYDHGARRGHSQPPPPKRRRDEFEPHRGGRLDSGSQRGGRGWDDTGQGFAKRGRR
jgi:hypothetical protein